MKLTIEKNPDMQLLARYFKKIEALAENMGIDVDDLMSERRRSTSMYTSFKTNVLSIAQKRIKALTNRNDQGSSEEAPIVGLTIIVNKDY
jgi:hypothetical protein